MAGAAQMFRVAARETVEETQKALVALAKREHGRVMATEPRPKRFFRTVDGKAGAREEQVPVDGTIIYRYPRLSEVVQAAMEQLFDLSPVLSGEYRKSHRIFVNGFAVSNLADWDETGEVMITNTVPYARKIEVGTMTMRVPGTDQVYQQAVHILGRRFGNIARIYFDFRGVMGGVDLIGRRGNNKSSLRYPALIISAR